MVQNNIHMKGRNSQHFLNLNNIVDKKETKTYQKYLNVVSNTCDFRGYLKNNNVKVKKNRNRASMDR
jgi:hypothetical protein